MKRSCFGILFICSIIIFASSALADRGVFNAKATPHEVLTNTPTIIIVTAEIGAENLYISSVRLYKTSTAGQPVQMLSSMYDDGTHGDAREADTIFTAQFTLTQPSTSSFYVRVTAAYQGDRNRYLSPVLEVKAYERIPDSTLDAAAATVTNLGASFHQYLSSNDLETARQMVLQDALADPHITSAKLSGDNLSIIYDGKVRGIVNLSDPAHPSDGAALLTPSILKAISALTAESARPGNNRLLIFAPYYNDGLDEIADHAQDRFDDAAWMRFDPDPPTIVADESASLDAVKTWGDYGTIIVHSHGGFWDVDETVNGQTVTHQEVILGVGTRTTAENRQGWNIDYSAGRIGMGDDGRFCIFPSFITEYCGALRDTFFYIGSCHQFDNFTMWDALTQKGAKVGFGFQGLVTTPFDVAKFRELIDPMLPTSGDTTPLTAKAAFDAVADKVDDEEGHDGAVLEMHVASSEWNDFTFTGKGLVNGGFETGDFTGWVTGGDYNYRIVSGARKHSGNQSTVLGRWDVDFHGYDPTAEPYGYEWIYQDFVVPPDVTDLTFYWWMETYDTAVWDWFDAYIKDANGNTLKTVLYHAGKPGSNYGPYWSTQMADGGTGWRKVTTNISAYRGQTIRIYFDQRLDGYGDQQRVYIDDVTLESVVLPPLP